MTKGTARSSPHSKFAPVQDYTRDFHRFGVDWQANHVASYIDGIKCAQFWNKGLLDPTLVRHLEVGYIRVFQRS